MKYKSVRLTKAIKEKFITHTASIVFKDKKRKLKEQKRLLDIAIYFSLYDEETIFAMSEFVDCKRAFELDCVVHVYMHGRWYATDQFKAPIVYGTRKHQHNDKFSKDDTIYKQYARYMNAEDELDKQIREFKTTTRAILNSCTTTKQLLTVWPECEKFLLDIGVFNEKQKNTALVCAEHIDKINKLLGV